MACHQSLKKTCSASVSIQVKPHTMCDNASNTTTTTTTTRTSATSKEYRHCGRHGVMRIKTARKNKVNNMFSISFLILCAFLCRGAMAANTNDHDDNAQSTPTVGFKTHFSNSKQNDSSISSNARINEQPHLILSRIGDIVMSIENAALPRQDDVDNTIDTHRHDEHNHTTRSSFENLLDSFRTHNLSPEPIYTNEFAVHIPAGKEVADVVAAKHGFINMGQIGALEDYYYFYHQHVSKRSIRVSSAHHSLLKSEPEVLWLQQQHEKVRRKRDGSHSELLSANPFDVLRPSSLFRDHRVVSRMPRTQYRDARSHNSFPDPLFKEQWYLNGGAKDGLDMNVGPAWQKGYTGKGVVVSILDDGIQTNHPDLAQNYDPDASFDINGNDSDPTPQDNGDNKHGTRCAGEVAAVAFNNFCGVGVAYNASIGGVRMLDGKVNDVVEAQALSLNPSHIDIYSASWGPEDDGSTVDGPGPLARRAFIYGVTSGRQGKGSIFVWASGNGGRYTDSCNCDGYTNSIFTLSISSATQAGFKPWYLEECSSTLATTYSSGTPGHDKSVATVDMDGRLRSDHICTVEHTGTSASAPLAAGICALALEANPHLTWRDMQYLVVYTSRPEPLEKEGGWVMNGVKRKFSHKFGYGLMDAGAMVNLAEQWLTVPPQHICKSRENNEDLKIEGGYGFTLVTHMDVNGCASTINEVRHLEHVQCRITLRFFPRGNLRIVLTSPMGTTSTLLSERPRDIVKSNFDDWPFLSVHYWGEKAEGRWTLQVINSGRRRVNQPGILSKWQLIFYGTAAEPTRLKSELVEKPIIRPELNPFIFSPSSELGQPSSEGIFFNNDQYGGYVNYQNLFTGAGSSPEQVVATVDDDDDDDDDVLSATSQGKNLNAHTKTTHTIAIQHDCDAECDPKGCYGLGPTQCVTCRHFRLDNACVDRCPPRHFPSKLGDCLPCHASCETCAGASEDTCLSCAPAHVHVSDLAVCLRSCLDGYFESNNTCIPCEPNCASCQNASSHCTRCDHHLVMHNNKCHTACPSNTYETEDNNCNACHASCKTCNSSAEADCISCHSGRFAHAGSCLNTCPAGYYADKKRQECVACPAGCSTCTTNGFCQACDDGWTLNKKQRCVLTGWENCKESEFYEKNECYLCHPTCRTCDGPTLSHCLSCASNLLLQKRRCVRSCDAGYYLEPAAGVCESCLHTCTHCSARTNCTACAAGLQLQNGECQISCADGFYSDRGVCTKCFNSCQTCSGPRQDQCLKCFGNWQLAGGECHPECPSGFYKASFGCQKCHHYCKTCKGAGPLSCTSCAINYMLDGGLCMKCLRNEFYDVPTQSCKACHNSCRSCYGPGQYSCKTCESPRQLDRLNNQCVPCCANDVDTEQCCHCDNKTGECMNVSSGGGKRRTAPSGQIANFASAVARSMDDDGPALDDDGVGGGVGNADFYMQQRSSSLLTTTAIAIAACVFAVMMFSIMLTALQQKRTKKFDCKIVKHSNRSEKLRNPRIDAESNLMINEYEDLRNDNSEAHLKLKHFDGACNNQISRTQRTAITKTTTTTATTTATASIHSDNVKDEDDELYESSSASTPLMQTSSEYCGSQTVF